MSDDSVLVQRRSIEMIEQYALLNGLTAFFAVLHGSERTNPENLGHAASLVAALELAGYTIVRNT